MRPPPINAAAATSVTVPTRTDLLRQGAEPKRPWLGTIRIRSRVRTVYHQAEDKHVLPGTSVLWDGYWTQTGDDLDSPGSIVWHGWDGSTRVLGSWKDTNRSVSSPSLSPTGVFAWVVGDYPESGQWTVFAAGPDGCTQKLQLPALASLLRGQTADQYAVEELGFITETELGVIVDTERAINPITTTSGRVLTLAGTPSPPTQPRPSRRPPTCC